jgi:hypothetical protein
VKDIEEMQATFPPPPKGKHLIGYKEEHTHIPRRLKT